MNPSISIEIDVLAVETAMGGNAEGRVAAMSAAFETAFQQLIETRGLPRALERGGEFDAHFVDGFSLTLDQPAMAGSRLAEVLYGSLTQ